MMIVLKVKMNLNKFMDLIIKRLPFLCILLGVITFLIGRISEISVSIFIGLFLLSGSSIIYKIQIENKKPSNPQKFLLISLLITIATSFLIYFIFR